MTEENQQEQQTQTQPSTTTESEVKHASAIEAATHLANRIEAGNKKTEELLSRQENLHAEQILGGRAEAGTQPEPIAVESDVDYANRIMRGELHGEEGKQE